MLNVLIRQVHYWASAVVAVPALVLIASGLLLQCKKHWTFVQPAEQRGTGTEPAVDFPVLLAGVRSLPEFAASTWADVHRIDVRPARALAKVALTSGHEIQIDLGTGRVLQAAPRRSDLIEAIHDGSFFGGDWTKLGVFLPTGIVLLMLWATGMWLWWIKLAAKQRGRRRATFARAGAGREPERASVPGGR